MDVVGYNEAGGKHFPIYSGPCRGCGATNYNSSTSGPNFCPACAIGTPPEVSKLRRELSEKSGRLIDLYCALEVALGIPCAAPEMQKIGERVIDEYKRSHPRAKSV